MFSYQVKKILREKDKSPITAFVWRNDGNGFIFGCKSGKLLSGTFSNKEKVIVGGICFVCVMINMHHVDSAYCMPLMIIDI